MKSNRLLIVLVAVLAPLPALAQVEAQVYSRARAQCGYDFQEQARLRCPGGRSACTGPLLTRQQSCLRRAEQAYVRDLRRQFRARDY